jgi:succinoglycan biosynthesis protein ExoM
MPPPAHGPETSIIIPTQRRPAGLETAIRSVLRQAGVDPAGLELVVVDNDQAPSAQALVEALAAGAPFPLIYLHEPRPGVATARNAALARAQGRLIAFLDDDEEAPPGWLAALLDAQARFDADVVFGPVRGRAPESLRRHRDYLERFFSREGPAEAGVIPHHYGCGDSLVRRAAFPDPRRPFSEERNYTGGEDTMLFAAMGTAGARFAWAPDAWVWEDPAPSRLSLRYTLARAFAYGQGPSTTCARASPPDWLGVAGWMASGLAQAVAFGALAAVKAATGGPDLAFTLDRAARGLGKTFWWGPFKLRFYGRAGD